MLVLIWGGFKDMSILKQKENNINTPSTKLKVSHLVGIGIGGIIGAGYFLGSGLGIHEAGPSIIFAYLLGGLIMMQVLGAMTSINVNRLAHGSFRVYTEQFLGSYFGFFLGWVVFTSGIFSISSEALAMAVFIKYWFSSIPIALAAIVFTIIVIIINAFNLKNLGRLEALMASLKIFILLLFIVIGIYFLLSKNKLPSSITSFRTHTIFPNGIPGFLQSMLIVIFSYSGISAVVMASTEVEKPKKSIHKATIYTALGVTLIYFLSMVILVNILPWTEISTDQSPFVQAFTTLGYSWASTAVNIVILIAAFSVMVATFYSCILMITSLAESKKAPKIFLKRTVNGLYKRSWILVGLLTLLLVSISFFVSQKLFNYLVSASSYFTFLNWLLNLITYLIWLRERNSDERYTSPLIFGKAGAYITILSILFMLVISLKVEDFRMGFYAAALISLIISATYIFIQKINPEK